ncbi:DUF6053 domain-containing protein [Lysobacter enzymogenes]
MGGPSGPTLLFQLAARFNASNRPR